MRRAAWHRLTPKHTYRVFPLAFEPRGRERTDRGAELHTAPSQAVRALNEARVANGAALGRDEEWREF